MNQPSRAPRGAEPRSQEPPVSLRGFDRLWAEVPEALLYAGQSFGNIDYRHLEPVSDAGVRAYGILVRHGTDPARCYPSVKRLAALLGKSEPTVRAIMRELEAKGWIQRFERFDSTGRQTTNGILVHFTNQGEVSENPTGEVSENPIGGGIRKSDRSNSEREQEEREQKENPPPTPSGGGGDEAPELFANDGKGKRRRRVKADRDQASSMVVVAGETFWEDWPSGKGRGQKAIFLDAWCKRLAAGVDRNNRPITISEYMTRRDHYRDARARYCRFWKDRGVEAHAPMLNGSTFVNSKSHLWAEEWDDEDIRYWPPPRGYDWDDGPAPHGAVVGRSMFDALDAEIAAERAAKEVG